MYAFSWRKVPAWCWPARPRPRELYAGRHNGFCVVDLHVEFWTAFDPANDEE
jgi:hypothetical protein